MGSRWKLTEARCREIAERYRSGELLKFIAADFGCTVEWVRRIARSHGVPARRRTRRSK